MANRGESQTELTKVLAMPLGQLSKLLYGDRKPGLKWAAVIEAKLGIVMPLWSKDPEHPFVPPAAAESAKAA